jgi:5'-nucleotidase
MLFLVSNDDGYRAPGISCLANALGDLGDVVVVAPDRNRSGASNSLTIDDPVRISRAENGYYITNGTPTDCVHLAITGLLEREPDMVIGGINAGENLGDDVLYSGTVAVAMEGRFLGLPAMAVSLVGTEHRHYETAARVAKLFIQQIASHALPPDTILNINVPDVPWADLAGFEVTRLGHRHKAEPVVKQTDPRGRVIYWIGPPGPDKDAGPGTDFYAIKNRCVSVTPLQVDLTRYAALDTLSQWIKGMSLYDD